MISTVLVAGRPIIKRLYTFVELFQLLALEPVSLLIAHDVSMNPKCPNPVTIANLAKTLILLPISPLSTEFLTPMIGILSVTFVPMERIPIASPMDSNSFKTNIKSYLMSKKPNEPINADKTMLNATKNAIGPFI